MSPPPLDEIILPVGAVTLLDKEGLSTLKKSDV